MAVDPLARPRLSLATAPWVLAAATVLAQVSYPLTAGSARNRVSVAVVLLFTAASLSHAWVSRRASTAIAAFAVTAGLGFGADLLGRHTGFPFGHYTYDAAAGRALGPRLGDVPLLVALAWTMFAWPAAVLAARIGRTRWQRVLVGGWLLAGWDLFLDPQMVRAGFWRWAAPNPHLPGVPTVPLTNLAGWFGVSLLISIALQGLLADRGEPPPPAVDAQPLALVAWTYLSSVLALTVFLHLAAAAGWAALALAPVMIAGARAVRGPVPRLRS